MAARHSLGANGAALFVAAGGAVLLYSGIRGSGALTTAQSLITGKLPAPVPFDIGTTGLVGDGSTTGLVGGGSGNAEAVIIKAKEQLGKPYGWAQPIDFHNPNPRAFDCSGLCGWAYFQGAGITLRGHNTNAYYAQLPTKDISQVAAGDLVYFGNAIDKHHMALYIGGGEIIEAPEQGVPVRIRGLTSGEAPWKKCSQFPGGIASATSAEGAQVGGTAGANQLIARPMAALYGWGAGSEWNALVDLWTRESGWSNTADTRKTGSGGDGPGSRVFAYGIPQARPASKLPVLGRPSDLGGVSDPTSQIAWGLSYIHSTYGSPSRAWAHELSSGWY